MLEYRSVSECLVCADDGFLFLGPSSPDHPAPAATDPLSAAATALGGLAQGSRAGRAGRWPRPKRASCAPARSGGECCGRWHASDRCMHAFQTYIRTYVRTYVGR